MGDLSTDPSLWRFGSFHLFKSAHSYMGKVWDLPIWVWSLWTTFDHFLFLKFEVLGGFLFWPDLFTVLCRQVTRLPNPCLGMIPPEKNEAFSEEV